MANHVLHLLVLRINVQQLLLDESPADNEILGFYPRVAVEDRGAVGRDARGILVVPCVILVTLFGCRQH